MAGRRSTCPYCGVGCGVVGSAEGRTLSLSGDADHPANAGRLCSKGTHLGETVGLEGRLLHPMIGEDGATWDEALSLVAGRLADIAATHGPSAVGGFSSARCTNEENYLFQKLFRAGLGSNNIDHCARL